MKTAVSLPEKVFRAAERLALRQGKSRSRLFADALAEYVVRHEPGEITRRINDALGSAEDRADPLVRIAGDAILRRTAWDR